MFDQTEFWELEGDQATNGTGANEFGAIYIPTDCQSGEEEVSSCEERSDMLATFWLFVVILTSHSARWSW